MPNSIEEDGLLWLHACYPRGADFFNAEDMLRAYEAGRAHPTTVKCTGPLVNERVEFVGGAYFHTWEPDEVEVQFDQPLVTRDDP